MTGTVEDALRIARSQLGYNGGGTSDNPITKYGEWYGAQTQWCAIGCSWVLYNADVPRVARSTPLGDSYCPYWVGDFQAAGRWFDSPEVGDLVFFSWNRDGVADHVGMVEQVLPDGNIQTIEFNTDDPTMLAYLYGNCCRRKLRTTFYVLGYGRPPYSTVPAPVPPPAPKDWFDMATKEDLLSLPQTPRCVSFPAAKNPGAIYKVLGGYLGWLNPHEWGVAITENDGVKPHVERLDLDAPEFHLPIVPGTPDPRVDARHF